MSRVTYLLLELLICFPASLLAGEQTEQQGIQLFFQTPKPEVSSEAVALSKSNAVADSLALLEQEIRFVPALAVAFGGDEGPLYDPLPHQILIPYSFVDEIAERFEQANYQQSGVSVEDAVIDSLIHTLYHEIGHALIAAYQLPIVGKEEDAVDSLATILLIELFEQGAEIAISAADLFDLESGDRDTLYDPDFWNEHSLDEQRYFHTLCLVYGSAPKQYAELIAQIEMDRQRAELCIEEYHSLRESWFELLSPYLVAAQPGA